MAKLIHKKKVILADMSYAKNIFSLVAGLMFASRRKISKGKCLVMQGKTDVIVGIHMLFCFYPYEVLFVNSKFEIVDKKILKPWSLSYVSKKHFKYAIESSAGKFYGIEIGDRVQIESVKRLI